MAFKDTWRRSLEYFGLVEGDYIEEGEYYDEDDTGQEMALDQTAVAPREAAPVSSARGGRRGRNEDIDDIFGEDDAPRRGGRMRSADVSPRRSSRERAPMGNGGGSSDFSMHVVTPRSFNDAQPIADEFKNSKPVIINLQN